MFGASRVREGVKRVGGAVAAPVRRARAAVPSPAQVRDAIPAPRELPQTALPATALCGAIVAGFLVWNPQVHDLAAGVFRAELFEHSGFTIWNGSWYQGHYTLTYSVLFAPLAALVGTQAVGAASAVASAYLFDRIVRRQWGERAIPASLWFALSAAAIYVNGNIAFALGAALGLASVGALQTRRPLVAAIAALACALASPLAGAFLGGVALVVAIVEVPRRREALGVAGAAVLPALLLNVIFHEPAIQPYDVWAWFPLPLWCAGAWYLVRDFPAERGLRIGLAGYALAATVFLVIESPMGSNVSRLGMFFGGPVLLAAMLSHRPAREWLALMRPYRGLSGHGHKYDPFRRRPDAPGRHPAATHGRSSPRAATGHRQARPATRRFCAVLMAGTTSGGVPLVTAAVAAATLAWGAYWQMDNAVKEVVLSLDDPSSERSYYTPLKEWLRDHGGHTARIEIPETTNSWEMAYVAPEFHLARGWQRQIDRARNDVFFEGDLTMSAYESWLRETGVRYVALPDVSAQQYSQEERELILAEPPFLQQRFESEHWRVWEVVDAQSLVQSTGDGVAGLTSLEPDSFTLEVRRPGTFFVLVHSSPFWEITAGIGCAGAAGEWTEVRADAPGTLRVENRFSLGAALRSLVRDEREC